MVLFLFFIFRDIGENGRLHYKAFILPFFVSSVWVLATVSRGKISGQLKSIHQALRGCLTSFRQTSMSPTCFEFPEVLSALISLDIQCTKPFETYVFISYDESHCPVLATPLHPFQNHLFPNNATGCRLSCLRRHHLLKSTFMVWKKHHGDRTILKFRSSFGFDPKNLGFFFWKTPQKHQTGGWKTPYLHRYSLQLETVGKNRCFWLLGSWKVVGISLQMPDMFVEKVEENPIKMFQSQKLKQFLNDLCVDVHWTCSFIGCYC